MDVGKLDVVVPVNMEIHGDVCGTVVQNLLQQNRQYGFTRFALTFPNKGWRSASSYPDDTYFLEKARQFRRIKDELAPFGIECAWWNTLTVKSGPDPRWHRMVRPDGSETPFSTCPLDEDFRRCFARKCAIIGEVARPAFIIMEDDFSINASTWPYGCFCDLHLDAFARLMGRRFSKEEILDILKSKKKENAETRQKWLELERDSLVGLAASVRKAVDEVAPEIPIGTMQAGAWDCDGDATEAVTRAFAGKNHTPFSRLYGTFYGGESIEEIPEVLYHALYTKQRIGNDIRCYHESDTFPHSRFFSSSATMCTLMASAYSFGFVGSTFQALSGLDNPTEETAYGAMFCKNHKMFQAIFEAAQQCDVQGVRLVYRFLPEYDHNPPWTRCISHFGIPYTTAQSSVTFLAAPHASELSNEEILELLHGNLFLDGGAAKTLFNRGFGSLLGVDVGDNPLTGMMKYDLESHELIEDGFVPKCAGRMMNRADFFSPKGNGEFFSLTPHQGAEVVTRVVSSRGELVTVGMTRFVNSLGGKVVVMGQGTLHNRCASLLNYRRQQLFQELIAWCSDDFVFVQGVPRVYVIMNAACNSQTAGFRGLLTMTNLNADALDSVTLHLPPVWRNVKRILLLHVDGEWRDVHFETTEDSVKIMSDLPYVTPRVFKLI